MTRTAAPTPMVAMEKYGPRRRKVGRPTTTLKTTARAAPMGSVNQAFQPALARSTVV
jgi:hypothetical protein